MNKELATKICTYIESSVTEQDILKNNLLAVQIESLKNYLLGLNSTHKCNAHPCIHFVRRLPAQAFARA